MESEMIEQVIQIINEKVVIGSKRGFGIATIRMKIFSQVAVK